MSKYTCICGKDCKNPNALKMHQDHCPEYQGQAQETKVEETECSCPNKRLLNPNVDWEKQVLEQGYLYYCPDCESVLDE